MSRREPIYIEEEVEEDNSLKSSFSRFCVTCVICILICSLGFSFLMFNTKTIYDVNSDKLIQQQNAISRVNVSSVTATISSSNTISNNTGVNIPGVTPNPPVVTPNAPGTPSNLTDADVYNKLLNSDYASKAYPMSCVYKAINEKYGHDAAVGVVANIWHEGNFGLVQYGHTMVNWNGDGQDIECTYNNPLIVSNAANVAAIRALGKRGNRTGVGIIGWTWYPLMIELADCYAKHCTTYSEEELAAAEMEMFMKYIVDFDLEDGLLAALNINNGNSKASNVANYWLREAEQPGNIDVEEVERRAEADNLNSLLLGGSN